MLANDVWGVRRSRHGSTLWMSSHSESLRFCRRVGQTRRSLLLRTVYVFSSARVDLSKFQIAVADHRTRLEEICKSRGYNYRDEVVVSREKLLNYDERIRSFFEEHLHVDEEVRYILDGCGYFDVRNEKAKFNFLGIWNIKKSEWFKKILFLLASTKSSFFFDLNLNSFK